MSINLLFINRICDDFEDAWHAGQPASIEQEVDSSEIDSLETRAQLLRDLVRVELELRRANSEHPGIQEYLERFPDDEPIIVDAFHGETEVVLSTQESRLTAVEVGELSERSGVSSEVLSSIVESAELGELATEGVANEGPLTPLAPGDMVHHYKVSGLLGRGSFGEVYLCRDRHQKTGSDDGAPPPNSDALYAVKLIRFDLAQSPSAGMRFLAETETLTAIGGHPGFARVVDSGATPQGRDFIVMEYISGESLKQRITKRVSLSEVVQWGCEIADAIASLHQQNIYHRDLKPSNVIIDDHGTARVIDLGLAIHADFQELYKVERAGTVAYMSPEQLDAKGIDGRADVWSLGVLLYELLAGERPFGGHDIKERIRSGTPRPLRESMEIPEELETIVLTCLQRDLDKRYLTAKDVYAALANFQKRHGGSLDSPSQRPQIAYGPLGPLGRLARLGAMIAIPAVLILLAAFSQPKQKDIPSDPAALRQWSHQAPVSELRSAFERPVSQNVREHASWGLLRKGELAKDATDQAVYDLISKEASEQTTMLPLVDSALQSEKSGDSISKALKVYALSHWAHDGVSELRPVARSALQGRFREYGGGIKDRHAIALHVPLDELAGLCEEMSSVGYQPRSIRSLPDGTSRVSVVWVRDLTVWPVQLGLDVGQLHARLSQEDLQPVDINMRRNADDQLVFDAIWRPAQLQNAAQRSATATFNVTAEEIREELANSKGDMVPRSISSLRVDGVERFSVVWEPRVGGERAKVVFSELQPSYFGRFHGLRSFARHDAPANEPPTVDFQQRLDFAEWNRGFDFDADTAAESAWAHAYRHMASHWLSADVFEQEFAENTLFHLNQAKDPRLAALVMALKSVGYGIEGDGARLAGTHKALVRMIDERTPESERPRMDALGVSVLARALIAFDRTEQAVRILDDYPKYVEKKFKRGMTGYDYVYMASVCSALMQQGKDPDENAKRAVSLLKSARSAGLSEREILQTRGLQLVFSHPLFAKFLKHPVDRISGVWVVDGSATQVTWGDADEQSTEAARLTAQGATPICVLPIRVGGEAQYGTLWQFPVWTAADEKAARQIASALALLVRQGHDDVWNILDEQRHPTIRALFLERLPLLGCSAETLVRRIEGHDRGQPRYWLLKALAGYDEDSGLEAATRRELFRRLAEVDAPNALYAESLEWLADVWELDAAQIPEATRSTTDRDRYESAGRTMARVALGTVVVGGRQSEWFYDMYVQDRRLASLDRQIGASVNKVATEDLIKAGLRSTKGVLGFSKSPEKEPARMTWQLAAAYCNWLSEKAGLPKEQWCFEEKDGIYSMRPDALKLSGFRMPTEHELEAMSRAGSLTMYAHGESQEYAEQWWRSNYMKAPNPLGLRRVNFGKELTLSDRSFHGAVQLQPKELLIRGGASYASSATISRRAAPTRTQAELRVVQTLPMDAAN